jgi:predicted dinucleotide-binding enzyme
MNFKPFASMNIAIIGNSEIGMMYAKGFALAGHKVFIAWENRERWMQSVQPDVFGHVEICSIEAAAEVGDLVIMAMQPKDVREFAYWLGDVRRKVIIDATGNVQTIEKDLVNTMNAIKSITGSVDVVKIFRTKGYEKMIKTLFDYEHIHYLMAGDSKKAKEITKIMAGELGLTEWYDFGGTENLELFNQMTKVLRRLSASDRKNKTEKIKLAK